MTLFSRLANAAFDYLFPGGVRPLLSPDPFTGFPTPYLGDAPENYLAAGGGALAPLAVAITSPSAGATFDVNTAATISGTVSSDADSVQVYLSALAPLGAATKVGSTFSIALTPGLLDHGSYNIYAVATRGAETLSSSTVALNISAIPRRTTAPWTEVWDARLSPFDVGSAVTANPVGLVSATAAARTNDLITIVSGQGGRKAWNFTAANAARLLAQIGYSGTNRSFTFVMRLRQSSASKTVAGFSNVASSNLLEFPTTSGMAYRMLLTGATTVTTAADPDFVDHIIGFRYDGAAGLIYTMLEGSAETSASITSATNFACTQLGLGANGRGTASGFADSVLQWAGVINDTCVSNAEMTAIMAAIKASDLPAVVGSPIMFVGDSTTKGDSNGGIRKAVLDYLSGQGKSIDSVGPYTYGSFADNQHAGNPGDKISECNTKVTANLGVGNPFAGVKAIVLSIGLNDANVQLALSTMVTNFETLINNLHTRMTASVATGRIIWWPTYGIDPALKPTEAQRYTDFKAAALTSIATFNAANPSNQIIVCSDPGAHDATKKADDLHPNAAGYAERAAAVISAGGPFLLTV